MCYTVPPTMLLPPRDQISALLKQMTMFSSPRLPYLSLLFSLHLELQTVGAAQRDIECNVVVCLSNLIKTTAVKDLADSTHFY